MPIAFRNKKSRTDESVRLLWNKVGQAMGGELGYLQMTLSRRRSRVPLPSLADQPGRTREWAGCWLRRIMSAAKAKSRARAARPATSQAVMSGVMGLPASDGSTAAGVKTGALPRAWGVREASVKA